ncbi:MAG: glycosyltransferase family 4 protein [Paludibacteraceae bacterium]|nr:glycosyltransferase family 4 protein [Paludibacteraceae bacterium]
MKIVYCIDNIGMLGGIERITITKANALAGIKSNEVWLAVITNKTTPIFPIDERIHLVNLDVNYYENDWEMNIFQQLKNIYIKKKEHKLKLHDLLNTIKPDIVISTDNMEKTFLPTLSCPSSPVFIRELHNTRNHRRYTAFSIYTKFIVWISELWDYRFRIRQYDKIVTLTHEDKDTFWKKNEKVIVIPNPISTKHTKLSSLKCRTVITAGRLVKQKNYVSLIRAWKKVHQVHPEWILEIWGEGPQRNLLQHYIDTLGLQNTVSLKGTTCDIISKMLESSIFVLSSFYEGFGLVITEAMSCGIPIVSYSCLCGPKDIISEGKDGFLVPVGNEQAMAERIIYLIEHEDVRQQMGMAALEKSKQYSIDIIIQKWMSLFTELLNKKRNKLYG